VQLFLGERQPDVLGVMWDGGGEPDVWEAVPGPAKVVQEGGALGLLGQFALAWPVDGFC
jgi:hypothetical protein